MNKTNKKKPKKSFRELLEKYLDIKGLDIVVILEDGTEIELNKNRKILDDIIIAEELGNENQRISIEEIISVDMYAA